MDTHPHQAGESNRTWRPTRQKASVALVGNIGALHRRSPCIVGPVLESSLVLQDRSATDNRVA